MTTWIVILVGLGVIHGLAGFWRYRGRLGVTGYVAVSIVMLVGYAVCMRGLLHVLQDAHSQPHTTTAGPASDLLNRKTDP